MDDKISNINLATNSDLGYEVILMINIKIDAVFVINNVTRRNHGKLK